MEMISLLKTMIEKEANALLIIPEAQPLLKLPHDKVLRLQPTYTVEKTAELILSLMNEAQQNEFIQNLEGNFSITVENVGRFNFSTFISRGNMGCVIKPIKIKIPSFEQLNLPSVLKTLAMTKSGVILVAGLSGMGKTTTLASLVGYRNATGQGHIITIEDEIEYLHKNHQCIVTQREIGTDTTSITVALQNARKQSPDMIQIGELKSAPKLDYAFWQANTGCLCLATDSSGSVYQTLDRISSWYPVNMRTSLWMNLSQHLKAIIAQRLVPAAEDEKTLLVTEILINTPLIADRLRYGDFHSLKEYMARKNTQGMHTFDQDLFNLLQLDKISYHTALRYADSQEILKKMIKQKSEQQGYGLNRSSDKPVFLFQSDRKLSDQ
ncbi:MAG: ATPase, T2SS/T4P/T4SS family [Candidatus Berkiellales bacterium]